MPKHIGDVIISLLRCNNMGMQRKGLRCPDTADNVDTAHTRNIFRDTRHTHQLAICKLVINAYTAVS